MDNIIHHIRTINPTTSATPSQKPSRRRSMPCSWSSATATTLPCWLAAPPSCEGSKAWPSAVEAVASGRCATTVSPTFSALPLSPPIVDAIVQLCPRWCCETELVGSAAPGESQHETSDEPCVNRSTEQVGHLGPCQKALRRTALSPDSGLFDARIVMGGILMIG